MTRKRKFAAICIVIALIGSIFSCFAFANTTEEASLEDVLAQIAENEENLLEIDEETDLEEANTAIRKQYEDIKILMELVGESYAAAPEAAETTEQAAEIMAAQSESIATLTELVAPEDDYVSKFANSLWAILPPVIAIVLALITKEVYSSLIIGIAVGGFLYAMGNFELAINHILFDGFVASLSDSYNMGIIVFLVLLGMLVSMMNKAGGSAAFGRWASKRIKSRVGAQIATVVLGCLIFIDDYFNCLTVGSVMRPVCDKQKVSRAKLAYLIDATAAPVCIIAPISSWAAAVAGFAKGAGANDGISLFIQAIPYNFYALFTILMMVTITVMKLDYGPMKLHENNAIEKGDLFTSDAETFKDTVDDENANPKGKVIDLVLPVVVLIIACVFGMIYSGGFFDGTSFIDAFSNSDASVGLVIGSSIAIVFSIIYFLIRRVLSFKSIMESFPEGFKAMVPAILILTCAWTLKAMTDSLGAAEYIAGIVEGSAGALQALLPAIIFLIAVGLSFATGTSWGTFGILIPIVLSVFDKGNPLMIVSISACMAGAVCGDHCSPISDTTIMASAGSQSNHINHVSTQLPYALTVAGVSFVTYVISGLLAKAGLALVALPIGAALMIGTLIVIKTLTKKKA